MCAFRDRSFIHRAIWNVFFAMNRASATATKAALVHGVIRLPNGEEGKRLARQFDPNHPSVYC